MNPTDLKVKYIIKNNFIEKICTINIYLGLTFKL